MPPSNPDLSSLLQKRFSALSRLKPSTREQVLNVFTPANIITQPSKFAGRDDALEAMINALHTENANLIVFGERGAGKSSLARMFFEVMRDNFEILEYYGLRERLQKKGLVPRIFGTDRRKFNAIWVDGFGKNLNQLIRSILVRRPEPQYGQGLLFYLSKEADKVEVTSKLGIEYEAFKASQQIKEVFSADKPETVKEAFETAMQRYTSDFSDEIIILIDEFETVQDGREISQYLKSIRGARFVLIGIAEKVGDLVGQHASVARETYGVKLIPMRNEELGMILDIGSFLLEEFCNIQEDAKEEIIRNSHNSPYWCHLLARTAVLNKIESAGSFESFKEIRPAIRAFDIREVVRSLPERPETRLFEELLEQTTMGDERAQKVLLQLASSDDSIMRSTKVVGDIEKNQGISTETAIAIIEAFLKLEAAPFREQGRILDTISFSFQDPNFKRYIRIRNAGISLAADAAKAS